MKPLRPVATIHGTVVHGAGRGQSLGFPTANLNTRPPEDLPHGIYAGWVRIDTKNEQYPAAIYWGTRPTFNGIEPVVEAYLLRGGGDWYQKQVSLTLTHFLRLDQHFVNAEELRAQMHNDAMAAAAALGVSID